MRYGFTKSALAAALFALALVSCAKVHTSTSNDAEKKKIEAWLSVNHPGVGATGNGIYILERKGASGERYKGETFIILNYTVRNMQGVISSTTDESVAKQIGTFSYSKYYGPKTWQIASNSLPAGLQEAISYMSEGEEMTVLIPSWLMIYEQKKSAEAYFKNIPEESVNTSIYTISIENFTNDIIKSQVEELEAFSEKYMGGADSVSYAYYYKQLKAPATQDAFKRGDVVKVDYIGRLTSGKVFDTSIADTAKKYNIYSPSRAYAPLEISWGDSEADLKTTDSQSVDESDIIAGMRRALWNMKKGERGITAFTSAYGYGEKGSGASIPPFAPLAFDITVVE